MSKQEQTKSRSRERDKLGVEAVVTGNPSVLKGRFQLDDPLPAEEPEKEKEQLDAITASPDPELEQPEVDDEPDEATARIIEALSKRGRVKTKGFAETHKRVSSYFPNELAAKLERMSKLTRMSQSELLQLAFEDYVRRIERHTEAK